VRELPSGTVTFLFTDIEGSTRLLHAQRAAQARLVAEAVRGGSSLTTEDAVELALSAID
jgi:hypothetical protein